MRPNPQTTRIFNSCWGLPILSHRYSVITVFVWDGLKWKWCFQQLMIAAEFEISINDFMSHISRRFPRQVSVMPCRKVRLPKRKCLLEIANLPNSLVNRRWGGTWGAEGSLKSSKSSAIKWKTSINSDCHELRAKCEAFNYYCSVVVFFDDSNPTKFPISHFHFQTQSCGLVLIKETPIICSQLAIVPSNSTKPSITDTDIDVDIISQRYGLSTFGMCNLGRKAIRLPCPYLLWWAQPFVPPANYVSSISFQVPFSSQ